jgi:uncharacterized damage-inducible protein DinB
LHARHRTEHLAPALFAIVRTLSGFVEARCTSVGISGSNAIVNFCELPDHSSTIRRCMQRGACMTKLLLLLVFLISPAIAQNVPEGIGEGYNGELKHVTSQLLTLAEATPADKFAWRPSTGVRSTSEVYMHIAIANFYFLSVVGKQTMPAEIKPGFEKSVTAKADVISWLKRSLEAARDARAGESAKELERKVEFLKRSTTADAVYLRLIIHCNEHMGQGIAYARMSGVTPPWSKD